MKHTNIEKIRKEWLLFLTDECFDLKKYKFGKYDLKMWSWIESKLKKEREEVIKLGREAGINSTYPCTNLGDESKNCESCNHDHSMATLHCRCHCCLSNITHTKGTTGVTGVMKTNKGAYYTKLIYTENDIREAIKQERVRIKDILWERLSPLDAVKIVKMITILHSQTK